MLVSIIMPTLNEESFVDTALQSIRGQDYAGNYEIILVDSGSTDSTVELASQYCDYIINAPKGKLTARNIATQYANGDIIVSVDADCYYPDGWLNTLVAPLRDAGVVGVRGRTIHDDPTFAWNRLWTLLEDIDMTIVHRNRMLGRNCAYDKDMFYLSGGFDESINQQDVFIICQEEEIGFGDRLAQLGKVVYEQNAICYHTHMGVDKTVCRIPFLKPLFKECQYVGTERF